MTKAVRMGVGLVAALVVVAMSASDAEAQRRGRGDPPDGVWLAGGLNASFGGGPDGPGFRLEAGIPLTEVGPGQLSFVLPFSTYHDRIGRGRRGRRLRYTVHVAQFVPEVQLAFDLPIDWDHRLSISPVIGFGFGGIWIGREDFQNDSAFMLTWRFGGVARLTFDFGLVIGVQAIGFTVNAPIDYGPDDAFVNYEWYGVVGYRFD